jgi:hypothetical protein
MQIILHSVEEELLDGIWGVQRSACLLVWLSAFFSYFGHLISRVEVRYHSRAELVVHVLKERFVHDIIIREYEHRLELVLALECGGFIHYLHEVTELL